MKEKYSDGIEWNTYEKLRKERPELFAESTQIPIVTDKETVDTFVRETGQKVGVMYSSEYHYLLVDLIRKCHERFDFGSSRSHEDQYGGCTDFPVP